MKEEVEKRVMTIVSEFLKLEPDEIVPDSDLSKDLRADSLDIVEITFLLEEEYAVDLHDMEWTVYSVITPQIVAEAIRERLAPAVE